jgi:hypothetical protein
MHLGTVHFVTAYDIEANVLGDKGHRQAVRIRPVKSSGKQCGIEFSSRRDARTAGADVFSERRHY